MTWWLQGGQADQPRLEPTTPDLPLASFGEGLSAAFSQVWRDVAVRNEFESRVADEEATSADEVIKRRVAPARHHHAIFGRLWVGFPPLPD
jgi:hypothetical protein